MEEREAVGTRDWELYPRDSARWGTEQNRAIRSRLDLYESSWTLILPLSATLLYL